MPDDLPEQPAAHHGSSADLDVDISTARSPGAFDRRVVLGLGAAFVATLTAACARCGAAATTDDPQPPDAGDRGLVDRSGDRGGDRATAAFVPVLVAIAERLVPSDDLGPGAREAQLGPFFENVFADERLATVHPLLKRGCAFLMKAARTQAQQAFTDLDGAAQDELLTRLSNNQMRPPFPGPLFVRMVLALTLEGFLGDPRHGGNHGEVGWRFVGYAPESRAAGQGLPLIPMDGGTP